MKEILKLNNIEKEYGIRGFKSKVLNGIDLNVNEGDFILSWALQEQVKLLF